MQNKVILLIVILVLFLGFYSLYYYYSINMDDEIVHVSTEDNLTFFTDWNAYIPEGTSITIPLNAATRSETDTFANLSALPSQWYSVVHGLTKNAEKQTTYTRLTFSQNLVFTNNFYVKNSPGTFADETVRMLIGRPGHRGEAAILYMDEKSNNRLVRIPYPGESLSIYLFQPGNKNTSTFKDVFHTAEKLRANHKGRVLSGAHQLQFPAKFFRFNSPFLQNAGGSRQSDSLRIQLSLRISAAQNDVSLLPSRRFPASKSEDDLTSWHFNQPYFLYLKDAGSNYPLLIMNIQDGSLLNPL